jgi:isocitrate/isopropylmalate dehydrogenase
MSPGDVTKHPTYRTVSISAEVIGLEVISAGILVLKKLAFTRCTSNLEFENFAWSSDLFRNKRKPLQIILHRV